jgi:carbon monoxide dehydrogenase subunit G
MTSTVDTFTGEEDFDAPSERVFAALVDLNEDGPLAKSIPDLVSADGGEDGRTLNCKVKPGFSFIRATMKMTIELVESDPSQRLATMRITSAGIGASMKIDCRMSVVEREGGSRVRWEAHVLERRGLLAAVSPTLIRGAADTVIRNGWDAMRRELGS